VLDLNETIENTMKMLRRLIGEDIVLAFQPGGDLWSVRLDPTQVDQMLTNVVVNARDAIEGVGRISIETANVEFDRTWCESHPGYEPGAYVMLSVSDNGSGMDAEVLQHLFEPFFTTKGLGKGTGLGLATVYGAVKQNGGFVTVQSLPGQGTSLALYLPRYRATELPEEQVMVLGEVAGGTETILLVEDEPALLRLGTTILERLGYSVLAASTPLEAIALADQHGPIQLLVTDVVMPEMNGYALAKLLTKSRPALACLFVSGYPSTLQREGVSQPAAQFLGKPFSGRELALAVRRAITAAATTW